MFADAVPKTVPPGESFDVEVSATMEADHWLVPLMLGTQTIEVRFRTL